MKIHFLCNDGSPIGITPDDIYERGIGGAELALLSLSEKLADMGHEVVIYNNPARHSPSKIRLANIDDFKKDESDRILVVFRSPNKLVPEAGAIRKIWWSTDQYTIGDFRAFAHNVNFTVTISPYHTRYHVDTYRMDPMKIGHIDLGVRNDYKTMKKIRNRLIFCSIPDRGLAQLHAAWPLILKEIPDATLVITGDYRLWGLSTPNNHFHRLMWTDFTDSVHFLGKVGRRDLVILQSEAEIMAYPCIYEELFCISAAECQVAGAYPVTSGFGALVTTNRYGTVINGDPRSPHFINEFVRTIVEKLSNKRDELEAVSRFMVEKAKEEFSWDLIASRWVRLFEEGHL